MSENPNATRPFSIPSQSNTFHLFVRLHDELQLTILSFIADAPFENFEKLDVPTVSDRTPDTIMSSRCLMCTSTLTHVLPYVCKKFSVQYCTSDELWKDAIIRQLFIKEGSLWYDALQNIIHNTTNQFYTKDEKGKTDDAQSPTIEQNKDTIQQLVKRAYQALETQYPHYGINYKFLYRTVLNVHLRQICPVFIMRGDVVLDESYGLHLFEYRYRHMIYILIQQHIRMVQAAFPSSSPTLTENNRTLLLEQFPVYFIHANRGNVRRSEMAVMVQLMECELYSDGRADIVVKPIQFVWIERSWLHPSIPRNQPNTVQQEPDPPHNLYYAQVLKMGQEATKAMHHLQRQETLTTVMERLIAAGIIQNQRDMDDDDDEDDGDDDGNHVVVRRVHVNIMENNNDSDDDGDDHM